MAFGYISFPTDRQEEEPYERKVGERVFNPVPLA